MVVARGRRFRAGLFERARNLAAVLVGITALRCEPSVSPDVDKEIDAAVDADAGGAMDAQPCLATSSRHVANVSEGDLVVALGSEQIYVARNEWYTQGGSGAFTTTKGQVLAVGRGDGRIETAAGGGAVAGAALHADTLYWLDELSTSHFGPGWPPGTRDADVFSLRWSVGDASPAAASLGSNRAPCPGTALVVTAAGAYVAIETRGVSPDAGPEDLGSSLVLVSADASVQTLFHSADRWTTCAFSDDTLYYVAHGALRRHALVGGADTLVADHLDISSLTVGDSYVAASSTGNGAILVFDKATAALERTIDARAVGRIMAAGSLLYWWRLESSASLSGAKRTLLAGRADGSCVAPIGSFTPPEGSASDGTGLAFVAGTALVEATAR